mmetsp:Transcript_14569/g.20585  ORF Transcript_14569/g.20585 Transcript_14569/m.20585 type:complete len:94 (-) Transcript_14569:794-1075(-)
MLAHSLKMISGEMFVFIFHLLGLCYKNVFHHFVYSLEIGLAYCTQSRPSSCAFALACFQAGGLSSIKSWRSRITKSATSSSVMSSVTSIRTSA